MSPAIKTALKRMYTWWIKKRVVLEDTIKHLVWMRCFYHISALNQVHIDDLAQDCGNSIAYALELLQSYAKA